jgi:NAD(P)-dependent dehydrogenase (short-subunit alcohol dehydrogenase family)
MTLRRRGEDGGIQEGPKAPQEMTFSNSTTPDKTSKQSSLLSNLLDLSYLVTAYVFKPIAFVRIYFAKMWPFSASFNPATAVPSLAGKVVIVTGGNIGLGKETILQLAKHNPQRIYMASRSESKALAAIKEIKSSLPKDAHTTIEYLQLDLSDLKSVKAAAQTFSSSNTRLDLLILNAGIMATPPSRSSTGHDLQLATNHLGHFLLTKLLLPTLQKTASEPNADVRVISLSSEAFNMSPALPVIMSPDLASKGPWARYGASKAANILFAAEFARRYPAIKAVSVHPGLIKTQLYEPSGSTSNFIVRNAINWIGPLMFVDVPRGAQNQLWAAAGSKRGDLKDGAYYTPVGKLQSNKWAGDAAGGKTFWEWTEGELAKAGY